VGICTHRFIEIEILDLQKRMSSDATLWLKDIPAARNRHDVALLVLAEAPGFNEDLHARPFTGKSGYLISEFYLKGRGLASLADIYLTNAVRCRPPQNVTPTLSHLKLCRFHLEADIVKLYKLYDKVIILACGASAARQTLGVKLSDAFKIQGSTIDIGTAKDIPVYTTYHPAYIDRGRNPAALRSVWDHLDLLRHHLEGTEQAEIEVVPELAISPPPKTKTLSLDIETYGAISTLPEQHYFHPLKSIELDGCPRDKLIQTVSLAWEERPDCIRTAVYNWGLRAHRKLVRDALKQLARIDGTIIGMNLGFDIAYLRTDPWLRPVLDIRSGIKLSDLSVWSYLHSEIRPERSLKALAPLFRIANYDPLTQVGKHKRYESSRDPELHHYNCVDTYATLKLVKEFESKIREDYPGTEKLSSYSRQWYSELMWTAIEMAEAGVTFNPESLEKLLHVKNTELQGLLNVHPRIAGKGSQGYIQWLIDSSVRWLPPKAVAELEITKVKKEVSASEHNRNIIMGHIPDSNRKLTKYIAGSLHALHAFKKTQKIVTSYLKPILYGRGAKGTDLSCTLINSRAYPTWYVVPAATKDTSKDEGGTNQGRLSAKQPAVQTLPEEVRTCLATRYSVLSAADLSQIEMRVAALLAGDPVMMQEYFDGVDRHTQTACLIFGDSWMQQPDYKDSKWRQAGKQLNFLTLYRGGADTFHETLRRKIGLDVPIKVCRDAIDNFQQQYPRLIQWQDELIDTACRQNYIELPLTGQSRTFSGDPRTVRDTYTNNIVNFPVQATASNILVSAQRAILDALRQHRLKTVCGLQVHDALYFEAPRNELPTLRRLLDEHLVNPPYYQDLCDILDRTVPLLYDYKIMYDVKPKLSKETPK